MRVEGRGDTDGPGNRKSFPANYSPGDLNSRRAMLATRLFWHRNVAEDKPHRLENDENVTPRRIYSSPCWVGTREPWIGEDPTGMIATNIGIRTFAPLRIGTRTVNDTTSSSRRLPRCVSISRRPGIHLGLDNHSRPRSIDSTRFIPRLYLQASAGKHGDLRHAEADTSVPLHYNVLQRRLRARHPKRQG